MSVMSRIAQRFGYVPKQQMSRRSYAAGQVNRLTNNWTVTNLSADAELRYSLRAIRARSRELAQNNDYAKKFLSLCKINVIGPSGIILQNKAKDAPTKPDKRANDLIEDAWKEWGKKKNSPDVTGKLSWLDIQKLFIESVMRDGEVLIRKVRGFNNPFNFALQFIEADHLDEDWNFDQWTNGNRIRMGVELDAWGRPAAYHVLTKHPGDYTYVSKVGQRYERVPASDIIHAYITERVGQTRGVPWMVTAMTRLNNLGGYEEAEIIAARMGACQGGVVYTETGIDDVGDAQDSQGNQLNDMEPGYVRQLPKGYKWEDVAPTHPGGNFGPFMKASLRGIASGLSVSYNSLASDLEGVNYSSLRSGALEERDAWKLLQVWTSESLCDQVCPDWLDMALLSGMIALPVAKYDKFNAPTWQPRGWDWVDPQKDILANVIAIDNKLNSRRRILAEQGLDFEEVLQELVEEQALIKASGLPEPTTPTSPKTAVAQGDEENVTAGGTA
jgi:lambda family phage portal protein